ncbi:methylenetetrahydrofolate reductase (NADPH)-like [Panonychus citri]|nr:methylenetetrahydrofolate reductase (NADPH)-like [Panonychus citri]
MDSDQGRKFLQEAKNCGIKYIFALRGDDLDESTEREFNHAIDIVRFIRAEFPNDFVVAVAGYPNGHPSVSSLAEDVKYLKAKVDAGADLIISQFFFNVDVFAQWVRLCRSADIKAPILPGIFTFPSYRSFTRMMKTTQVPICNQLESKIENISNCDQQIKQFAIEQSTQLCLNLVNQGLCPGLHFFSLNKDSTLQVIEMIEPKIPRTTINQQLLRLSAQLEEFTLDSGSETLEKNQPSVKSGDKTPESSNYHQN